ncbi:MAG: hypothetical protein IPI75_20250 [Gammaproteobacteria bacterium]|nr:hypothetical protein [Gammaproteobacteria bacterium]
MPRYTGRHAHHHPLVRALQQLLPLQTHQQHQGIDMLAQHHVAATAEHPQRQCAPARQRQHFAQRIRRIHRHQAARA